MKKWLWRGLLLCCVLALGAAVRASLYYGVWMKMSPEFIAVAEKALAAGVVVEDSLDDFVIMGSNKEEPNENNPSPYRLPYLDVKSLSVGADSKYLYYKVTFREEIPMKSEDINGDKIKDPGIKLGLLTDDDYSEYAILCTGYSFIPIKGINGAGTYYFYGPTGIVWPEDARFLHQDSDSKVAGGPGADFIMGAFPLEKLGLKLGQKINLSLMTEARSEKYSHAAVDNLGGEGKMPAVVTWNLGSDKHTVGGLANLK